MVKIKLARIGKKKQPEYRIIVVEQGRDPWGTTNEIIGHFSPLMKENAITLKEERVKYWLGVGAQPTDTLRNMFIDKGLLTGKKVRSITITKRRAVKIAKKAAAAQAA